MAHDDMDDEADLLRRDETNACVASYAPAGLGLSVAEMVPGCFVRRRRRLLGVQPRSVMGEEAVPSDGEAEDVELQVCGSALNIWTPSSENQGDGTGSTIEHFLRILEQVGRLGGGAIPN
ncbi:hypothetical protein HPB50_015084 [Hyalomma asiaticum]|uniref:Uncharacterized protein n=1 Tax=Hyalomma asiaticum TaxID=266040 RepID=A0ACB7T8A1_HYAAI|nr:hypothetical protein HPB50_015084 [Hyalomma asiaticum]